MQTCLKINELRIALDSVRKAGQAIAFVPTMGNLHTGHISLIEKARELGDCVVASIFVNPLQFGVNEDLDSYPRTLEQDQKKLLAAGTDFLFTPTANEMYPQGMARQTQVSVPDITETHCGASRPGHFMGVATVVSKLFNIVQPQLALFGEKDFQQLAVIRKLVRDMCIPIEIVGIPTARDSDGLALSSRNGYLNENERAIAPALYRTLAEARRQIQDGEQNFYQLEQQATRKLAETGFKPDYFSICDATTLQEITQYTDCIAILAAASLGNTRLIDNVTLPLNRANN